jgi:predicted small secreted protein
MSGKPLVALILLAVLSLAACQPQNGAGDAKSDPDTVRSGGISGGGGGGGY